MVGCSSPVRREPAGHFKQGSALNPPEWGTAVV